MVRGVPENQISLFLNFIEAQLIYNVVLISAIQQRNSVIHVYILFPILFHSGLSQDMEHSPLCYTVDLFVYPFYIHQHLLIPNSQSVLPSLPLYPHEGVMLKADSKDEQESALRLIGGGKNLSDRRKSTSNSCRQVKHHLLRHSYKSSIAGADRMRARVVQEEMAS